MLARVEHFCTQELAWYATIYVQGRSANGCGGTLRGTTDGFPTTVTLSITASFGVNDTTDDVPPPSLVEATDAWYSQVRSRCEFSAGRSTCVRVCCVTRCPARPTCARPCP